MTDASGKKYSHKASTDKGYVVDLLTGKEIDQSKAKVKGQRTREFESKEEAEVFLKGCKVVSGVIEAIQKL